MSRTGAGVLAMVLALASIGLSAAPAAAGSELLASGTFEGRSGHTAEGGVSVLRTDGGAVVVLEPGFSFDGAPDPRLGFGRASYDKTTQFSRLRRNSGAQVYVLPDGLDPAGYDGLWIWCEKYSVPLGRAVLR